MAHNKITSTESAGISHWPSPALVPLVSQRSYDPMTNKYGPWETLHYRPVVAAMISLPLEYGGIINLYPHLINKENRGIISNEILQYNRPPPEHIIERNNLHLDKLDSHDSDSNSDSINHPSPPTLLRQYQVANSDEPRLNRLLHPLATMAGDHDDESTWQPGYRYGRVTMKARSFENLPRTRILFNDMELIYARDTAAGTTSLPPSPIFNIGAHVVFYRGSEDGMGAHADNKQGEEYILTVVLLQTNQVRDVVIAPNKLVSTIQHTCIQYKLTLCEGDGYAMDGSMQQFYLHSVPKISRAARFRQRQPAIEGGSTEQRLVIVFRRGQYKEYRKDSGRSTSHEELMQYEFNLHQKRAYTFGAIPGRLIEGKTYSRKELFAMGAHQLCQRSVSGNKETGCNAILVSGLRHEEYRDDQYDRLIFCATNIEGGLSVVTSHIRHLPIRVFRSSNYNSIYRAPQKQQSGTVYRYDGLYEIVCVTKPPRGSSSATPFVFELTKLWESFRF